MDPHLATNDDALAADGVASTAVLLVTLVLGLGAAVLGRLGEVAAAGTATVELDTVALAGDAVAFTAAVHGGIAHGGERRGRSGA